MVFQQHVGRAGQSSGRCTTWARNATSTLNIQILKKPNNSPTAGHCAHCLPAYAAGVANGDERAVRHVHAMVATDLESKLHRNFGNRLQLLADTSATRYQLPDLKGWGMDVWLMDVLPLWDQKWSPYWRFLFVPQVVFQTSSSCRWFPDKFYRKTNYWDSKVRDF